MLRGRVTGEVRSRLLRLTLELSRGATVSATYALRPEGTLRGQGLAHARERVLSALKPREARERLALKLPAARERMAPEAHQRMPMSVEPREAREQRTFEPPGAGERTRAPVEPAPLPEPAPPPTVAETPMRERPSARGPLVRLEVGTSFSSRSLTFEELQSPTVGPYSAPFILSPRLGAQLFPFKGADVDLVSELGLELDVAFALALQSRRVSGGPSYGTQCTRMDAAALWRVRPFAAEVGVTARVGYRRAAFALGRSSSDAPGMPGVDYSALRVGLTLDASLPFLRQLRPAVGFSLLPVLSAGELVSPAYFTSGGASGLELQAGASFALTPQWEVRASAELTRYALGFRSSPGDVHSARAAVDQSFGVSFFLRYAL